jgi:hypothetical protein
MCTDILLFWCPQISQEQLAQIAPSLTEMDPELGEVLLKALRILPDHAIDLMVKMNSIMPSISMPRKTKVVISWLNPDEEDRSRRAPATDAHLSDTKSAAENFYRDAAAKAAKAKNCSEDEATEAVSKGGGLVPCDEGWG